MIEELDGKEINIEISDEARSGDHIWWISDIRKFRRDYPAWEFVYDLKKIIRELIEETKSRIGNTA